MRRRQAPAKHRHRSSRSGDRRHDQNDEQSLSNGRTQRTGQLKAKPWRQMRGQIQNLDIIELSEHSEELESK